MSSVSSSTRLCFKHDIVSLRTMYSDAQKKLEQAEYNLNIIKLELSLAKQNQILINSGYLCVVPVAETDVDKVNMKHVLIKVCVSQCSYSKSIYVSRGSGEPIAFDKYYHNDVEIPSCSKDGRKMGYLLNYKFVIANESEFVRKYHKYHQEKTKRGYDDSDDDEIRWIIPVKVYIQFPTVKKTTAEFINKCF